jgi:hypothetical protein
MLVSGRGCLAAGKKRGEVKKMDKRVVITALLLAMLVIGICGCLTPNAPTTEAPTPQPSQVKAYADAYINSIKSVLGPNETVFASRVDENGSNAVRVSVTTLNTSKQFSRYGTTQTYALNIQQFPSKEEATAFYNNVTFGYTIGRGNWATSHLNVYTSIMGHNSTINNSSYKIDHVSSVSALANSASQQDEFVVWGTISAEPAQLS